MIRFVAEFDDPAVRLHDLAGESKANAGAGFLGRVADGICRSFRASLGDRGDFRLFLDTGKRRLDGVTEEVDEELLDLVGVGEEFHIGGREQPHLEANLKRDDPLEQRLQGHALEDRRRQLRELAIGLDESVQRFGAVLDNGEAALQIALQDGDGRRGRWGRRGCSG